MKYRAREGSPITDDIAQVVGKEVESLRANGQRVTPHMLVDRAKRRASPLHNLFDWNDKSAARKHRVEYARLLLRSVTVIEVKSAPPRKAHYSVVEVTQDDAAARGYIMRREVVVDDGALAQVGHDLYRRIAATAADAEGLGLASQFPQWQRIVAAVRRNRPPHA